MHDSDPTSTPDPRGTTEQTGRVTNRTPRDYQVRGPRLLSILDAVRARFGSEARQALETTLRDRQLFPVVTSSWYAYDDYVALLQEIARVHYRGDVTGLAELGRASAGAAVSSKYQAAAGEEDFLGFLTGLGHLHHLSCDRGQVVIAVSNNRAQAPPEAPSAMRRGCSIVHRNKPRYDDADLFVTAGFYARAGELHGLESVQCSFEMTQQGVDFFAQWA